MGIFEGFRDLGWNTYYGSFRTAVTYDIRLVVVSYISSLLALACIILILGTRKQEVSSPDP